MRTYFFHKLLIAVILILGFFLRFYRLGDYPALNADEAAIGYNAYSLIKTGMDEHGNPWPIHFQSFNDYKPGLYVYLVIPFIHFLGLNEWSVRIPGALLGVGSIYLIYLLTAEFFKRKIDSGKKISEVSVLDGELIPIISAFMLAVSPWHIHFSRGGWEVNAATFFIIFGVYLFLRAVKTSSLLIFNLSVLFFVLSLYTYHSARIIAPLLGLGLILVSWKNLGELLKIKSIFISSIFFIVVVSPLVLDFFGPAGISRVSGVGLLADSGPLNRVEEQRSEHENLTGLSSKILHNKPINYFLAFMDNWGKHYHGEFLFVSGDVIQRNKVPETGLMYLTDFFLVLLGVFYLIKNFNQNKSASIIVFYWLLIAPIASAMTFQSPHALRAQNMVVPLVILSALGLAVVIAAISKISVKSVKFVCIILVFASAFLQVTRYLKMYYQHMSKEYPYSSQYGLKELTNVVKNQEKNFDKIVVSDVYDQPYILFLFYLNYPPEGFQSDHVLTGRDKYGFSTVRSFGKYSFEKIDWNNMRDYRNTMLVGVPGDFNIDANIGERILFPNGNVAFEIVPL